MKRMGIAVLGLLILFVCWLYERERENAPVEYDVYERNK